VYTLAAYFRTPQELDGASGRTVREAVRTNGIILPYLPNI
jgi:hypothetical protein